MLDKRMFLELDENRSIEDIAKMIEHGPLTDEELMETFPEFEARYQAMLKAQKQNT